jgi:hypothetical protein
LVIRHSLEKAVAEKAKTTESRRRDRLEEKIRELGEMLEEEQTERKMQQELLEQDVQEHGEKLAAGEFGREERDDDQEEIREIAQQAKDIAERAESLSEFVKSKVDALDFRQDEYETKTSSALTGIQRRLKELNEKQEDGKNLLEMIGKFVGKSMIEDEREKKELEKEQEELEKEKDKEDKDKNNKDSEDTQ